MSVFCTETVKIGDRVVVSKFIFLKTYIERIEKDDSTGRIALFLDWGEFGKSRVWMHDFGETWFKYDQLN